MSEACDWLFHPRQQWQQHRRHARDLKEVAEYHRERDPTENAESTPPADEEIRLHAVWLAESYPPSFFESLLDAVARLTRDSRHSSGEPPAERIEEALRLGRSGWFPLGPVVPPGSPLYAYLPPIRAVLPADVEHAHASVHYLVPSHAVFVMCFVLDETASKRVEERLRATYQTYTTPHGNWTAIHGPANQKREAVRATRAEHMTELATFFDREAPGLFLSDGRPLPSIEFWTTKERKPFQEREERGTGKPSRLHRAPRLGRLDERLAGAGQPGVEASSADRRRLLEPGAESSARRPRAGSVRRRRPRGVWRADARGSPESAQGQHRPAGGDLGSQRDVPLLRGGAGRFEAALACGSEPVSAAPGQGHRRSAGSPAASARRHRTISRGVGLWQDDLLRVLRHHTIDFERWAPPSLREESDGDQRDGEERSGFRRWLARLRSGEELRSEEPKRQARARETWLETQTHGIVARAEYVVAGSREISDVVHTISETTSTQASLRLQRWVAILTWVLAAIGVATLVVVIVTAQ
jgi:hypothetical protein